MGYTFALDPTIPVDGSIVLCGKMPMHQLERRQPKPPKRVTPRTKAKAPKYPHMASLLFDPQLYLAGLDPNQGENAPSLCANLATYPWFGVPLPAYDSAEQKQSEWKEAAAAAIGSRWPQRAPTQLADVQRGVEECVDLQLMLGCEAIILPSPLTHDQNTTYDDELRWIDEGYAYAEGLTDAPIYATVALSDVCLRFHDPDQNSLLELISDAVSARGVDGVYLVVEQTSEAANARQCSSARVLASALHLTHLFAVECELDVVTNFFGAFGLACAAAGARCWSSNWYKSLHRLRLADHGAAGRAFPSFWSSPVGTDIHLESDFDKLVAAGMLPAIADVTPPSAGLLQAAGIGRPVSSVPAWEHRMGNIQPCSDHYLHAAVALEHGMRGMTAAQRIADVDQWLASASTLAQRIATMTGTRGATRTNHVPGWLEAFRIYRRLHNV